MYGLVVRIGCMDWLYGWDVWMDGWMDRWMDRWIESNPLLLLGSATQTVTVAEVGTYFVLGWVLLFLLDT